MPAGGGGIAEGDLARTGEAVGGAPGRRFEVAGAQLGDELERPGDVEELDLGEARGPLHLDVAGELGGLGGGGGEEEDPIWRSSAEAPTSSEKRSSITRRAGSPGR